MGSKWCWMNGRKESSPRVVEHKDDTSGSGA